MLGSPRGNTTRSAVKEKRRDPTRSSFYRIDPLNFSGGLIILAICSLITQFLAFRFLLFTESSILFVVVSSVFTFVLTMWVIQEIVRRFRSNNDDAESESDQEPPQIII